MRADTKEFFALPDAFRAVFVLRALEDLSVDETAAAFVSQLKKE